MTRAVHDALDPRQLRFPTEIVLFARAEYDIAEAEPKGLVDLSAYIAADAAFLEMLERFAPY
ncbi:MAG: hypothetical protein ABI810_14070 [Sphingomonas bacterium]